MLFEYDRGALAAGDLWRGLTGHLVHYSGSHLAWNLLGFGVLGLLCESADRTRFGVAVGASALLIPLGLQLAPELSAYRGLSGVTSALFGLLAVDVVRGQWARGERGAAALTTALATAFVAKLAHTWSGGDPLLVTGFDTTVEPVPLAHAIGLAVGVGTGFCKKEGRNES